MRYILDTFCFMPLIFLLLITASCAVTKHDGTTKDSDIKPRVIANRDSEEEKQSLFSPATNRVPLPFPIAFTSERDGQKEIYVVSFIGSSGVNISQNQSDDNNFHPWRKGGIFVSQRDGDHEIYYVHYEKKLIFSNLTKSPSTEKQLAVSKDLESLFFTSNRDGDMEIFLYLDEGFPPKNITRNEASDEFPVWMPDGKRFLFESDREGNYQIFIQNIDDVNAVNITNSQASDKFPSVSPDGKILAFESDRDGKVKIYFYHFENAMVERISGETGLDNTPIFSNDSTSLAYNHIENDQSRIEIMNLDDRSRRNITDFEKIVGVSGFSPDDAWLLFVSKRTGNLDVFIVSLKNGELINVSNNEASDYYPTFFPSKDFPLMEFVLAKES